jgi:hypothetical protein
MAGKAAARDPSYTVGPQRERLAGAQQQPAAEQLAGAEQPATGQFAP